MNKPVRKIAKFAFLCGMSAATAITTAANPPTLSPTPTAAAATTISPTHPVVPDENKKQLWNLQDADIRAVIQTISSITGKSFVVDPQVQGKITIISTQPMDNDEAYSVFLSMLQVLNYSAIPTGDIVKIVPSAVATQDGGTFSTSANPGQGDEVVVRVLPVENVSATQLVPILRPLIQQWGSVSSYDPSNTLIFAGSASNINRMVRIVQNMDKENASGISVISLKFASAEKLASVLQQLQSQDKTSGKNINISIIADTDNNSLLLGGSEKVRVEFSKLIKTLDTGQASASASTVVVHLNYLTAKEVAALLTKVAHGEVERMKKNASAGAGNNTPSYALASSANDANPEVSIEAETNDNAVVISAPVNIVRSLEQIIKAIDVAPQQVLVEAVIVNVKESVMNQLGISWGTAPSASAAAAIVGAGGNPSSSFQQGVGYIPGGNMQLLISALESNDSADILSTPSILVVNNQPASISEGETVSMINRQYSQTNTADNSFTPFNTMSRTNVALTLKVTPQISPNDMVKLKINQKDNSLQNPNNPGSQPLENTSSIITTVLVRSGDILVLGGLLKHDTTDGSSQVPILGDLPLLGPLFHYKNKSMDKENLMVFIKPVILNNAQDSIDVTRKRYEYMRYQEQSWNSGLRLTDQSKVAPLLPGTAHAATAVDLPPPSTE